MDIDANFTFIKSIILLIISTAGIIGNIISFFVFVRKTFRKNTVCIYCCALAIFDTSVSSVAALIYVYYILYDFYILNLSDFTCAFLGYGYYTLGSIPGWVLVAFSIDRTLSLNKVTNVLKRPILHYMIVIVIYFTHFLLYIEVPIYLRLSPLEFNSTVYLCDITSLSFGQVLNVLYGIQSNVIPFLIMIISSVIIIIRLKSSEIRVEVSKCLDLWLIRGKVEIESLLSLRLLLTSCLLCLKCLFSFLS